MEPSALLYMLVAIALGILIFLRVVGANVAAQRRYLELEHLVVVARRRREETVIVATPVSADG